ncbi:MAG: TlpA disulfide reductase family protein, partial [Eubacteriales bacterium]|nr:TlpA disulfide reductase family protein [Eubacteriales bacterium]
EYEGKVVVLNFWQSWCPPCRAELPDFQKVYEDLGENANDVVILGVSTPANEQQAFRQEQKTDGELKSFLEESGVSFPSLMDYTGEFYAKHNIVSFPTTILINPDGNYYGIVPGALSEANLVKLIDEAKESSN